MTRLAASIVALVATASLHAETARSPHLALLSQDAGSIAEIDAATSQVARTISLSKGPATLAAAPDGQRLYVTYPDAKAIGLVDVATGKALQRWPFAGEPFGIAAGAHVIYVSDWARNNVSELDSETGRVRASVEVGRSPAGLVLDEARQRLYVADRESDDISVIDVRTMRRIATIPVGRAPFVSALSPDRRRLYVADVQSGDTAVIDTEKLERIATVATGSMPYGIAVTPDNATILVANQHAGTLSLIDAEKLVVIARIKVGRYPEGVVCDDRGRAYVANWFSGDVSVVDLAGRREVARIKVGDGPRSFAVLAPTPDHH